MVNKLSGSFIMTKITLWAVMNMTLNNEMKLRKKLVSMKADQ